ncbi:MAG: translation initiation factor IF-3 [Candidatus Magasanikbacteria bacterium]
MRISHKRKKEEPKKNFLFNENISFPQVYTLDSSGTSLGILNTADAIRAAREQELDLVVINPKAEPPIAKIMDFGQFRYQQEKEQRIRKAHQHVIDTKVVRMSLRIGKNDLNIRKVQTLKFLNAGDKVKIEIVLRGRENQQAGLAFESLKKFLAEVNAEINTRFEQMTERQGNKITTIIVKN